MCNSLSCVVLEHGDKKCAGHALVESLGTTGCGVHTVFQRLEAMGCAVDIDILASLIKTSQNKLNRQRRTSMNVN